MSGCADNRFLIMLLVRGELDAAEEARLRAHLATCQDCARELAGEERLSRTLDELPKPSTPDELKTQVLQAMRGGRSRKRWRRIARRPLRVAIAAAVVALLALSAALLIRTRSAPDSLTLAARQAASVHQTIVLQRDLLPSETAEVAARLRELAQRYSLPATTAFQGDEELRLVSVRPGSALGKVSAVLIYLDRQGRVVTLEILPGAEVQIPPDRTRQIERFRPAVARVEERGVVLWKQGGALYVLTAPVGDEELARLFVKVRTHTS